MERCEKEDKIAERVWDGEGGARWGSPWVTMGMALPSLGILTIEAKALCGFHLLLAVFSALTCCTTGSH